MSDSSDPALPGRPDPPTADDRAADFDSPWKEAIGAYFQPFMALFFPAVHDRIDWNQPHEFLDAELQQITGDADLGRRYADRLVKVYSVAGAEVWLLIHIEVQGRADEQFPARMFQYYYRIYDRYGDVEILSLAVVTNQTLDPELALDAYQREREGYGLRFRFRVQALRDWSEATLIDLAATNPFAVVALAQLAAHRRFKEVKRKVRKREIIALLYRYGYSREDVLQLLRFIDWLIRLPQGLELEFRNELIALEEDTKMAYVMSIERMALEKGWEKGREEGMEKGREEGKEEMPNLHHEVHQFGTLSACSSPVNTVFSAVAVSARRNQIDNCAAWAAANWPRTDSGKGPNRAVNNSSSNSHSVSSRPSSLPSA